MFWFRLAALFGCTVGEAQQRVDSREFAEWMAAARIQSLGDRAEWSIARLGAVVAAAHGGKLDESWFLWDAPPKRPKSGKQMEALFRQFAAVHNRCQQQSQK